tara:strand:- start:16904 stop:17419 length:516 start_codon:yes stop_codon:yes gene_type:complete
MRIFYIVSVVLFLMTFNAQADGDLESGSVTASYFRESGGNHSGIELSALLTSKRLFALRFSAALFSDESSAKIHDLYGGFLATGYLHLNHKFVNPYIGLGLYAGETYNCSESEDKDGTCSEDIVLAAFPEVGIGITMGRFHVFPFLRRYFDTNSHAGSTSAYGLHVGFTLE